MSIEQLLLRVDGHAGQVGADLAALAAVHVALGALVLEDHLAGGRVALLLSERQQLVDAPSAGRGSGRPPPLASSRLRPRRIRAVRVGGQGLLLVERQLGERHLALRRARRAASRSSSARASSTPMPAARAAGRERRQPLTRIGPRVRRLARRSACEQPTANSGGVRGVIRSSIASRPLRRRSLGSSISSRAAAMRLAVDGLVLPTRVDERRGRPRPRSCRTACCPRRSPAARAAPRRSGRQPGERAGPRSSSSRSSSFGGLSGRPAPRQAADDRPRPRVGSASASAATSRPIESAGPPRA